MEARFERETWGRKSFNDLVQRNPAQAHPLKNDVQSISSLEGVTVSKSTVTRSMQCMGVPVIREHGWLRKHGTDAIVALETIPESMTAPGPSNAVGGFSPSSSAAATLTVEAMNKAKHRLPGSRRKRRMEAPGSSETGFVAQVVTVDTGEDVVSKIMTFLQQGPRAVCILSACGVISKVTFQQATTSSETMIYEGHFEILSLSGLSLPSESGDQCSRAGRLSVSLAFLDGRILGGVPGLMTAASTVQVVLGSFIAENREVSDAAPGEAMGACNPPSQGTSTGIRNQS
ncbi:AT-hook motif nuclear-localized protein 1-like isoform X2 [Phoenix dactylifera]|uniref:AT-hook motif nuclear-localized protein n=1 Tax=Phoenix dactylifera TaxID=42345 RepID=A0A8B9ALR8_PHODC|nr:AT-hook motif nuclear-localized protein 1-like isoform X2 [Phoenix dactylifera]